MDLAIKVKDPDGIRGNGNMAKLTSRDNVIDPAKGIRKNLHSLPSTTSSKYMSLVMEIMLMTYAA